VKNGEGSNSATDRPTRNYAIDALRFIAVCFVVYIHIFEINKGFTFSDSTSWKVVDILFGISRLAVPVFFAISGWYIFSKIRAEQIAKLQKQIPKLIKILVAASIGTGAVFWLLSKLNLARAFEYFPDVKHLFEMFALGKSPTIGVLWFLVSLVIVELLYLLVTRTFKRDNWLMIVGFAFFSLILVFSAYRAVVGLPELPFPIFETWFVAFVWFTLGYFLAKYFRENNSLKTKVLVSFTITVSLFYLYEYLLHTSGAPFTFGPYNYNAIFLFTPFVTAGILLLAARSKSTHVAIRALAYFGKNYALGVFIIHLAVMQPINALFLNAGLLENDPTLKLIVTYSATVLISFGLTALYYKVKSNLSSALSKVPVN